MLEPLRAAQRKSADREAAMRSLPALECNALSVITHLVLGSDAVMASTLTSIGAEPESGQLTLLGSEPWLVSNYGIVKLKSHPLTSAAARSRMRRSNRWRTPLGRGSSLPNARALARRGRACAATV